MNIVISEKKQRLITLRQGELRLYDCSFEPPRFVLSRALPHGHRLVPCDDWVAVLAGEPCPNGASLDHAVAVRFDWDLSELGSVALGSVEKRGLSVTEDGQRMAFVDWTQCRVVVADSRTGERIASGGEGIPSGVCWSPDGRLVIAGSADQGSGSVLLFDMAATCGDDLAMEELAEPDPSPGLDDAPYFAAFGSTGRTAVVSNESWGGRGLFVYDVTTREVLWSKVFDSTAEDAEPEDWYPFPAAFTSEDRIVLVSHPGRIQAHRSQDGAELGNLTVPVDGRAGFAVEHGRERIWVVDGEPTAHPFPASWRA